MPIPALVGAAIVTGAAQLLSSAYNNAAQRRQNKQNYDLNKKLTEKEYAQNLKMWHIQNEYNSPSAQMARYQAAGINPNVLYGQGSDVSSGNTGDVPAMDYPAYAAKAPFFDMESPIQAMLAPYQISNIESQTAENLANASFLSSREKRTRLLMDSEKQELDAHVQELNSSVAIRNVQIEGLKIDNEIKVKTKDAVISVANLQVDLESARLDSIKIEQELKRHQIKQVDQAIDQSKAQVKLLGEQALLVFRQRNSLFDSIEYLNYANAYSAEQNGDKLHTQNRILEKELANWDTRFNAEINKMATEMNLSAKQAELFGKKVKNYVWTEYVKPTLGMAATAGTAALLKGKGIKNPQQFKGWKPGNNVSRSYTPFT